LKQTESLVLIFESLWRIQKYQGSEEGQIWNPPMKNRVDGWEITD